ncbi:MAG TPA: AMP-binding protein, partial [Thermoanaerobaculia bacterium]|nr:AMP-binding protein [Thermoanaerobaculia bacterium]
ERARVTPEKTALVSVETGQRLTYAQFDERVSGAAATILETGASPGERVGLLGHNSIDYVAFFFGALRASVIAVPLSTRATAHELGVIAADCEMRCAFVSADFAGLDFGVQGYELRVAEARPRNPQPATRNSDEDIACLLYTSGTTGKPKGVMVPRRQLLWNGYNTAINWGLRDDDVSPVFTPMYHAGGLAAFLIPIFCVGGTIVIHKSFNPAEVWRIVEAEGCTVVLGVPTIWKLLLEAPEFASAKLDRVRWFISGGAPLPQYLIDAYQQRGIVFKQGYGMTEVGVNCFTMTVDDSYRKPGSIGRPMMFTEVRLVNTDGEVGEMEIRGAHLSRGYWNNETATREAYGEDGWFRTGDLARRDEEGFFFIAGRRKEMFISGGVNVYPAEIEAELVSHAAVADAAVLPVADETWGEVGVAFIVGTAAAEELEAWLLTRLARYKLPRRYVFIEALPRTPYGKVEKARLRDML